MQLRRLEDAKKKITGFVLAALLAVAAVASLSELRTVSAATAVRDLAAATPESVGVSAERLRRIDDGHEEGVDDKADRRRRHAADAPRQGRSPQRRRREGRAQASDPVQKDSIFRIYSMTKPITGVGDDDALRGREVAARRSGVAPHPGVREAEGLHRHEPRRHAEARRRAPSMTMRELMTHTAGLGYILSPSEPGRPDDHPGRACSTPPRRCRR